MSGDSSGEKTEEPTEKKKRDARKKGQIAQSKDFVSAVSMVATVAFFVGSWDGFKADLAQFFDAVNAVYSMPFDDALAGAGEKMKELLLSIVGTFVSLSLIAVLLPSYMTIGFLFTMETVTPKFEKLNPVQGVKKLFNMKNLIEFLKGISKMLLLVGAVILIYQWHLQDILLASGCGFMCLEAVFRESLWMMTVLGLVIFVVLGAFDLKLQQWLHIRSLKMTKDEVKREYKQSEGDPLIKSERKQIGQDMILNSSKISEAAVLIFGGGIAVALKYEEGETPLPLLIAKGTDDAARRVMAAGRKAGVPAFNESKLARELAEKTQSNDYISEDFVPEVARILGQAKSQRQG